MFYYVRIHVDAGFCKYLCFRSKRGSMSKSWLIQGTVRSQPEKQRAYSGNKNILWMNFSALIGGLKDPKERESFMYWAEEYRQTEPECGACTGPDPLDVLEEKIKHTWQIHGGKYRVLFRRKELLDWIAELRQQGKP